MTQDQARVFVIDDEPDVREAMSMLIRSVGLQVETYGNALEFLNHYQLAWPGCIVADIRMPGMSGLELQEKLNAMGATIPLIFISGHADVPTAVRAIQDGAMDLLEKPFRDQLLLDKVQSAIRRDQERRTEAEALAQLHRLYDSLTPREKQVMAEVVSGKMNKVIASDLHLSTRTVELHRANLMEKLQVHSVAELVRLAQALEDNG
ncbi:DNA-binding response regulator [Marinobacterium nitratireducens]|uniref:DNA-binding response regulator n=1 Tax=Marinobacterium nitratireducens TaxID=518897 RepID=A0A918DVY2_9GAMM|nr:response regulator [Marinobacterium nitratireducens]GGO85770.1 DNA-binding response regulator [Marinobacterium nitratireducens]